MNEEVLRTAAGCQPTLIRRVCDGSAFADADFVVEEVAVALEYNGVSHAVMMATPTDLEDFALGFSLTEKIVDGVTQIHDMEMRESSHGITMAVQIASPCFARLKERRRNLSGRTGCGLCGTDSLLHAVRPSPPVDAPANFQGDAISRAVKNMRQRQWLLDVTGASHAAAWCDGAGDVLMLREDVGRHNALDKLVGAIARARMSPSDGFVAVTSRASYEMVQKTAVFGSPLLAAISGVTGLAIDHARAAGLTLIGFARSQELSIYTHPHRIQ